MRFEPFEHMAWAKRIPQQAEFDLAGSGIPGCTWADLGLDPSEFPVTEPNYYGLPRWRAALASRFGVSVGRIVPVAGASAAVFAAVAAFAGPGELVVSESPSYEALRRVPALFGARLGILPGPAAHGFRLDLDAVRALARRPPRLLLVSDPHNPSGVVFSPEERAELARTAERGGFHIICDEVYREFLPDPAAPLALESPWIISAASLTKAYGLGPLRAGWMVAQPPVAERLRQVVDLAYVEGASISEAIAARALERLDRLRARTESLLGPRRAVLDAWLSSRRDLAAVRSTWGFPSRSLDCPWGSRDGPSQKTSSERAARPSFRASSWGNPPTSASRAPRSPRRRCGPPWPGSPRPSSG